MTDIAYHSMGLVGYEIWPDHKRNASLMCRFVDTEREHPARSYRIQITQSGRAFIRPNGRRVYLDEIVRANAC